jgi:hypothetical protein
VKKHSKCPFPKCRRRAEHDGDHSPQNTRKNRRKPKLTPEMEARKWKPGESGNPGGRPKRDVASEIAAAIFENNAEAIGKAYLKLLKRGSLGAFSLLSDRAFGKVAQPLVGGGEGTPPISVKIDC